MFELECEPVTSGDTTTYRIKEMVFYLNQSTGQIKPLGYELHVLTYRAKKTGTLNINGFDQKAMKEFHEQDKNAEYDSKEEQASQALFEEATQKALHDLTKVIEPHDQ